MKRKHIPSSISKYIRTHVTIHHLFHINKSRPMIKWYARKNQDSSQILILKLASIKIQSSSIINTKEETS